MALKAVHSFTTLSENVVPSAMRANVNDKIALSLQKK